MPTELKTMIGKKFGTHDWMPLAASLDRRMTMSFMHHIHLYLAEMLMWSFFQVSSRCGLCHGRPFWQT